MRRGLLAGLGGGLFAIIFSLAFFANSAAAKPLSEGGFLGVYTDELDIAMLEAIHYDGEGILIEDVVKDSPADKAGIKPGDILVKFNDRTILSPRSFERALWRTDPGDEATIVLWRDNNERSVTVTLTEKPETEAHHIYSFPSITWIGDSLDFQAPKVGYLGVTMNDLGDQLADYFGAKKGGVLIESVEEDSPAEKAGFKAGDVIVKIDQTRVDESGEVSDLVREHKKGDQVKFTILRDKKEKTIAATLGEKDGFYWSSESFAPALRKIIRSSSRLHFRIHPPRIDLYHDDGRGKPFYGDAD
ncbi:MAG: PDZ domain-containing protein [bacterium]